MRLAVEDLAEFERALEAADTTVAVRHVEHLLDAGAGVLPVLVEIIAAAQRRVGERWLRGEWSVAREHAATGVSVAAAGVVARHARRVPVSRGRVVLACAEREWHLLPALLVAYGLRADGWEVVFLGASTPQARFVSHLHDIGPDVTAVSCSVLRALPSTREFIEASTECGIPVLAGGAAFGRDGVRAAALGATGWAGDVRDVVDVVARLPTVVPPAPALPVRPLAEQRALDVHHSWLVAEVLRSWQPEAAAAAREHAAVWREGVEQVLFALQATLVTGDARILSEAARWVDGLLGARGVRGTPIRDLADALARNVREFPLAADLVHEYWPASPYSAASVG